ncbi:lyase family protein [Microbacterium sp. HMH0099]|uniref:lyase family protein n=1 Tax=Microbacterium sp. HMH0099 TaxID=3414026 RepID=UPI003BF743E0
MPSEVFDSGLLSPGTLGHDDAVSDAAVLDALVAAEVALLSAYAATGALAREVADAAADALEPHGLDVAALAAAGVAGGNPVIPLVGLLRPRVPAEARPWVHRGATSQDVLDTALALVGRSAAAAVVRDLDAIDDALTAFARDNRDVVAAARTLTQHAVPTTVGARAAGWVRGIRRAATRVREARDALPAQLGGAAGTLSAAVADVGIEAAAALPGAFAEALGLATPDAPWHTQRWPFTELADALVQAVDALGVIAADVATLGRTEIAELSDPSAGGSSAMPQKANPVASVLLRAASLRAPLLGATVHAAAAGAVDERPDGAWHAEWPALRELCRVALGAAAHGVFLAHGLRVDAAAVARNLDLTDGLIVSERLRVVLVPLIGAERFGALLAGDGDLAARVRALPEAAALDVDALLDPAEYVGLAPRLVDDLGGRP